MDKAYRDTVYDPEVRWISCGLKINIRLLNIFLYTTNSMAQCVSYSAGEENSHIFQNLKVHYHICQNLS